MNRMPLVIIASFMVVLNLVNAVGIVFTIMDTDEWLVGGSILILLSIIVVRYLTLYIIREIKIIRSGA